MSIMDLVPWKREKPGLSPAKAEKTSPVYSIHREMNRLFDHAFGGFPLSFPFGDTETGINDFSPSVDITENDDEVRITAEVPGMDEKSLDISLSRGVVSIKGEKRSEHKEKKNEYYRMERSYGSFHRAIPVPSEIDEEKATATCRDGILTIVLPKTARARREVERIAVKSE